MSFLSHLPAPKGTKHGAEPISSSAESLADFATQQLSSASAFGRQPCHSPGLHQSQTRARSKLRATRTSSELPQTPSRYCDKPLKLPLCPSVSKPARGFEASSSNLRSGRNPRQGRAARIPSRPMHCQPSQFAFWCTESNTDSRHSNKLKRQLRQLQLQQPLHLCFRIRLARGLAWQPLLSS